MRPFGSLGANRSVPPWAAVISATIDKPRPTPGLAAARPPFLREASILKNGSTTRDHISGGMPGPSSVTAMVTSLVAGQADRSAGPELQRVVAQVVHGARHRNGSDEGDEAARAFKGDIGSDVGKIRLDRLQEARDIDPLPRFLGGVDPQIIHRRLDERVDVADVRQHSRLEVQVLQPFGPLAQPRQWSSEVVADAAEHPLACLEELAHAASHLVQRFGQGETSEEPRSIWKLPSSRALACFASAEIRASGPRNVLRE